MTTDIACIILAAGQGTRMKSDLPKVLHKVAGRPMLRHVITTAEQLGASRIITVIAPGMDSVAAEAAPHATATQVKQRGTGDAVMAARDALDGFDGTVLVLYGDSPLIRAETLRDLADAQQQGHTVAVMGMRPDDSTGYGRLKTDDSGELLAIVEHKDASEDERAIGLVNAGMMAVDGGKLFGLLDKLDSDNAQGEFYLTDIIEHARADGLTCTTIEAPEEEGRGVNSRAEQAVAEAILQQRLREAAMAAGVTLIDPSSTYLSADTSFGRDVVIEPHVIINTGVSLGDGVTIHAFSHLEGCTIAAHATIGPYARLRPGADIGEECRVGNFVEIKKSKLGKGAKASHLTYLGDAEIGAGSNIGAGTITCNYDGFNKSKTEIGEGVFIGSNSALVAPVKIGNGAIVGAGSIVTKDVSDDALAVARGKQVERADWAKSFRAREIARRNKAS
ncbi:MAG: bifunctional UDP-N-acetylglucosamine diphosphorylase/glucosamine-1-phosphate N-acetyltransferase GlmU [Alphaproteobacteria bacterium]